MNFFEEFQNTLCAIAQDFCTDPHFLERITAEPPRDPSHGDLATNAAMVLAKPLSLSPRQVAEKIVPHLQTHDDIESVAIAGPGFINVTFTHNFWHRHLKTLLTSETSYGDSTLGHGQKLNIEYVSVNPTGPMHVGHCRGAIVGDILASLLQKAGYDVTREFYMNDAGNQVTALAESLYARYCQALGHESTILTTYGGDYLIETATAIVQQVGDQYIDQPYENWLPVFKSFGVEKMMALVKNDLHELNVYHDVFSSEKYLVDHGKVQEALEELNRLGLIYEGILEPPKGKVIEDYEPRPQILFKSTEYGDDCDRPLKKSDGSWTYFANDVAYHFDKYQRGFMHLINIWGADHGGYVKRLSSAVSAITQNKAHVDVHLCQMVKFMDQGTVLKMSKRAGVFVTVHEAIQKVGKDALRFLMVWRKNDAPLDFDFQKAVETSKDNPVFYVQYAHARICSVMRHAHDLFGPFQKTQADLSRITDPNDLALVKVLTQWPRMIETAALAHEPHRIAYFMYEVAGAFHSLWNTGKEHTDLRFIHKENKDETWARLALLQATAFVLHSGLNVMGVTPVEEMLS